MFLVDFQEKRIVGTEEVLKRLASKKPYGSWLNKNRSILAKITTPDISNDLDRETLLTKQITFGYTQEDLQVLRKMFKKSSKKWSKNGSQKIGNSAQKLCFRLLFYGFLKSCPQKCLPLPPVVLKM